MLLLADLCLPHAEEAKQVWLTFFVGFIFYALVFFHFFLVEVLFLFLFFVKNNDHSILGVSEEDGDEILMYTKHENFINV